LWLDNLLDRSKRNEHQEERVCAQHASRERTAVERIAAFTSKAKPAHLTAGARELLKRNILDSIGCAIAALPGAPFRALRDQFEEYRSVGSCTLIGGGTTSVDQAALYNSGLVRYVDLLDSYLSPGGLCHPSDNFGAVLAAGPDVLTRSRQAGGDVCNRASGNSVIPSVLQH
jgi:2-methylcitrate dehydratase PrpD